MSRPVTMHRGKIASLVGMASLGSDGKFDRAFWCSIYVIKMESKIYVIPPFVEKFCINFKDVNIIFLFSFSFLHIWLAVVVVVAPVVH